MDSQAKLAGKRILVAEDEYLLAHDLRMLFEREGASVVGPYASCSAAMTALLSETFDCAVLDIALAGGAVYPLAEELRRRGTPFMFLTVVSTRNIRPDFADAPCLEKPFDDQRVLAAIRAILRD